MNLDHEARLRGALLGSAVGDALGAPYEGLWSDSIPGRDELLVDYGNFEGYPRGQYTDDTQLTLATVESIVERAEIDPADIARSIAELWRHCAVIGPGGACSQAAERLLAGIDWLESGADVGQAGNGAAMRTAFLGIVFLERPEDLARVVADVSRITHRDARAIAGGVAVAAATRVLAGDVPVEPASICEWIAADVRDVDPEFAQAIEQLPRWIGDASPEGRAAIAWAGMGAPEFDRPIITPFVVPTVMAALEAVLTNVDSWEDGVAAAIGWGGDVDTLGAIVGGILGGRLGEGAIPDHLVRGLVDAEQIVGLAKRLALVDAAGPA